MIFKRGNNRREDNKERVYKYSNNASLENFDNSATDIDFILVMKLIAVTTYSINMLLLYAILHLINR